MSHINGLKKEIIMKKIVVKATTPEKKLISLLFDNIEIILKNKHIILNNPNFYNVCIDGIGAGSAYTGEISVPLGVLVQLWEDNLWHDNNQFTYHIGGSPLSGLCYEDCWDMTTRTFIQKTGRNFVSLARPAFRAINKEKDKTADFPINIPAINKAIQTAQLKDVLDYIAAQNKR